MPGDVTCILLSQTQPNNKAFNPLVLVIWWQRQAALGDQLFIYFFIYLTFIYLFIQEGPIYQGVLVITDHVTEWHSDCCVPDTCRLKEDCNMSGSSCCPSFTWTFEFSEEDDTVDRDRVIEPGGQRWCHWLGSNEQQRTGITEPFLPQSPIPVCPRALQGTPFGALEKCSWLLPRSLPPPPLLLPPPVAVTSHPQPLMPEEILYQRHWYITANQRGLWLSAGFHTSQISHKEEKKKREMGSYHHSLLCQRHGSHQSSSSESSGEIRGALREDIFCHLFSV